jgi:hypothetical protein
MGAWAGSDNRHISDENIPELRQLIEIVLAKEPTDAREAGIVFDIKLRTIRLVFLLENGFEFFGVLAHGSEFHAGEFAPAAGFALVGEEERPAVLDPDRQHDDRTQR